MTTIQSSMYDIVTIVWFPAILDTETWNEEEEEVTAFALSRIFGERRARPSHMAGVKGSCLLLPRTEGETKRISAYFVFDCDQPGVPRSLNTHLHAKSMPRMSFRVKLGWDARSASPALRASQSNYGAKICKGVKLSA
jgi:hypothetical protein